MIFFIKIIKMSSNFNYNYNNNSQNRYYNTVQPNQNYNLNQSSNNFNQPGMYNTNYNNYNNNYNNNNNYDPNNNYNNQIRNSAQYSNNNNNNYFIPMEKNQRIKWKNVLRLDLNFIQQTNDLSMLEAYLENLIYSNINEDEISSVPEGNVAKLIKIYQFTIEYLLNSQTKLENQVNFLQEENSRNSNKIEMKDSKINEDKDTINRLKKQIERDRIVLLTYQNAIANLKRGRKTNINISLNESQNILNEKNGEKEYYCKFCTGKKFDTKNELDLHLRKAHLIDQIPIKNEESKNNDFEKKLDEMKNQFQNYVQQFQTNSMMKYIENQRKMDEEQHEKQMEKLEKSFKDTLIDLKDFYIQNMNKNPNSTNLFIPQPQIIEKSEKIEKIEKNNENNELTSELQKQLALMNQILENLRKENEMRLKNLQDNFQEQIEKLKQDQNQQNKDLISSINVNIHSKENPKNDSVLIISQQNQENYQPKIEKPKPKKEKFFASDLIESDHDESDEENKQKERTIQDFQQYTQKLVEITTNTNTNERKIIYMPNNNQNENKKPNDGIIITKEPTSLLPNKIEENFPPQENDKKPDILRPAQKIFYETENLDKSKNPFKDFYKIYKHREQKIFKQPNEDNFNEDVLPKDYQKNATLMKNSININFNQTMKNISKNHDYDFDNFDEKVQNKSEHELLDLIDKTLKNIKNLNSENQILNEYYNTIQNYLDLKLIPQEMENILSKSMMLPEKNVKIVSERFDENISEVNKNFNSQSMNKIPTGKKIEQSEEIKSKKSDKKSQINSFNNNNNSNQIEEMDINIDNNNNNFEDEPKIIEKKNNLEIPNEQSENLNNNFNNNNNIDNNIDNNVSNDNKDNNDSNNNNNNNNENQNEQTNNQNNNNLDIYEEDNTNLKQSVIFNNSQKQLNNDEENNLQESIKKEEEEKKQNNINISSWDKKSNEE